MTFANLLSAGLIAAAAIIPAAASAQQHGHVVVREHSVHRVAPHRTRKVCNTVYRNHHRTRVCRTVRY